MLRNKTTHLEKVSNNVESSILILLEFKPVFFFIKHKIFLFHSLTLSK